MQELKKYGKIFLITFFIFFFIRYYLAKLLIGKTVVFKHAVLLSTCYGIASMMLSFGLQGV